MTEQSCFHHKYFTKSISPKDFHYPQEIVELSIKIHIISSDAIEPYGHFFLHFADYFSTSGSGYQMN